MKKILNIILLSLIIGSTWAQSTADYCFKFLKTEISEQPEFLKFRWLAFNNITTIKISRKLPSNASYTLIATLSGTDTVYIDNSITKGVVYDYSFESVNSANNIIARSYIHGGILKPEVNDRGKILLLVDSTYSTPLANEIKRLIADMECDGWVVIPKTILRTLSVIDVKNIIKTHYISDPTNLKSVFLLGHIAVPYSGNINPDGHTDHKGAWPCDGYYADMTGTWTDATVNNTTASDPRVRNVPGDGKFDQSQFPNDLKLEIGRVDLYNLPEFALSDIELTRQYLNKNHNFRNKKITVDQKAVMTDIFGLLGGEYPAASGWRAFTSIIPFNNIVVGDYRSLTKSNPTGYIWGYGCGPGDFSSVGLVTHTMYFNSEPHGAVFNMLFGSYFGDWDSQNNVMRSSLASQGNALTCNWSARPFSILHHMAMGETIGYAMKTSMNNYFTYPTNSYATLFYRMVHDGLMGDPTLRMHVVSPPENVHLSGTNGNYKINWSPANDTDVLGYNVYVSSGSTGIYKKLNSEYILNTSFEDNEVYTQIPEYLVKTLKKEKNNSGSYINQSQGIKAQIFTKNTSHTESGFIILQDKYNNRILNVKSNEFVKNSLFEVFDLNGRQVLRQYLTNESETIILPQNFEAGMFLIRISSLNKLLYSAGITIQ